MPGAPTPPTILAAFGFSAGAGYITTPIPFASQQPNPRASYTDGFPPQTVGATATDPPDVRDFNGILYSATANIAAFSAGQFFQFNSSISTQNSGYALGAIVLSADYTGLWINQTSGNTSNPDTAGAGSGWMPLARYGLTAVTGLTNANVTLTAPQAAKEIITLAGTLTGNVQIIFPAWEDEWLIANNTSGAFTVTCKTASGSGVVVPQGVTTIIYGDGTNINLVGSSLSANSGAVSNTLALRDGNAYLWAAAFRVSSDRRLKKNLRRIKDPLVILDRVRGYLFDWRKPRKGSAASVLAQEWAEAAPLTTYRGEDGFLYVDPMGVSAYLLEMIRALDKRLSRYEKR
jgi:hypothetical protein